METTIDPIRNDLSQPKPKRRFEFSRTIGIAEILIAAALAVGLALIFQTILASSAAYDETAYLNVASTWYRTGKQESITRMGSPLTFWKLQQVPTLWFLDALNLSAWVDDPIEHQSQVLTAIRAGSTWLWVVAFAITTLWARLLYGRAAAAAAAWLVALGPNLIAHASIATMEIPVTAAIAATTLLYWRYLQDRDRRFLWGSAAVAGIAFSCKFTTAVFVPILFLVDSIDRAFDHKRRTRDSAVEIVKNSILYIAIFLLSNVLITGFSRVPLSEVRGRHPFVEARLGARAAAIVDRLVEIPLPSDWVGFATQINHQRTGGPSYLLGERRMHGWRSYYIIAFLVKTPPAILVLLIARFFFNPEGSSRRKDRILPMIALLFLAIASAGSTRNYGVRYLLPVAPLTIVWLSGLAASNRLGRSALIAAIVGVAVSTASIHPYELSYFNILAGGAEGGKTILSDSNLDWGQGLRSLAKLQSEYPEFRDITIYYFGDVEPRRYKVFGIAYVIRATSLPRDLPAALSAKTRYVGVSRSLAYGPWGPEGYFDRLKNIKPVVVSPDHTFAIYLTEDLRRRPSEVEKR
jgi:hypothetical protein